MMIMVIMLLIQLLIDVFAMRDTMLMLLTIVFYVRIRYNFVLFAQKMDQYAINVRFKLIEL